ncbi:MAG: HD domain-containing phosphohydrolase, partial [Planctomycetota bacterium]
MSSPHFKPPPLPADETARLTALLECQVLDTDPEPVFEAIVASASALTGMPIALISLIDEHRQWFKANVGLDASQTSRELSFCGHAILADVVMQVPDTHEDERFARHPLVLGPPNIRAYFGAPLELSTGEKLGTLCVIDREPRVLDDEQLAGLKTLADQAAAMLELRRRVWQLEQTKLENERLIEDLRSTNVVKRAAHLTIFSLARLAEARDHETGAHLERVRTYCRLLATQLAEAGQFTDEIDDGFIELIYQTSPLHDIGKVAVPDCVLLKPGRLDEGEFAIMQTHAEAGAETLNAALSENPDAEFLRMARDIALTHHERFDGKGYPQGLRGGDIPLCGRITAVADVYDALTSKRVYKGRFSHDIAQKMIIEERGRHFDPRVVDAFHACAAAFDNVRREHAEVGDLSKAA